MVYSLTAACGLLMTATSRRVSTSATGSVWICGIVPVLSPELFRVASRVHLERRAQGLGIEYVRQGSENKTKDFEELLRLAEVDENEVAFVGDDLNDIPLMLRSEFAVAVSDAAEETRAVSHLVTQAAGGSGAIREVIEFILKAQGRWAEVTEKYLSGAGQVLYFVFCALFFVLSTLYVFCILGATK